MKIYKFKYIIKNFIEDWIYPAYKIHNRLYKRFDLVRTNLSKYEYNDVDNRMLHAVMSLFCEYVEKEQGLFQTEDINYDMLDVYFWWKFDYQKELDTEDISVTYSKCNMMLKKVIDFRHELWT